MNDKGELTTKALLTLKTYLECGCDKAKTARKLNRSYQSVYQQLHQPYVHRIFQMLLLEKGITFERLAKVIDEGLDANKVISAIVVNKKDRPTSLADGELFDANEKTNDFIEVPDHPTRHRFLNTALEAFEILRYNTKAEQTNNISQIFINLKADGFLSEVERKSIDANNRQ